MLPQPGQMEPLSLRATADVELKLKSMRPLVIRGGRVCLPQPGQMVAKGDSRWARLSCLKSVLALVIRGGRVCPPRQSDFVLQRPATSGVMLLQPLVVPTVLWRVGGARPWLCALIVACETLVEQLQRRQ